MSVFQKEYEDILKDRRQEVCHWFWVSRALKTKVAVEIVPRPSPQSHKESVLISPRIKDLIEEIIEKEKVPKDEVEKQLRLILDEIGYKKNLKIIRWIGYTLIKIFLRTLSGIYVNYEGILELTTYLKPDKTTVQQDMPSMNLQKTHPWDMNKVKSKMGKCPVIFVPSHRSYIDFTVFSYIFYNYNIEIPAIAAGVDFHGMKGVGEILRNTGAFYMRRTYNDDSIYWTIFKEYINQIVTKGDLPIEFFIEGTRSRSNKSISPKFGLFNMFLKAFFLSQVPDILFVPVSISYDRILEESNFPFELLGIPKNKESTSGLLKSVKILKEKFGNIYFHVGKPISTKDFFGNELDKSAHNFGPQHLHEITDQEKRLMPPLAYKIVYMQQQFSPVGYFNLIALIFNNHLIGGHEFMHIEELLSGIKVLKKTIESWGAIILEQDVKKNLEDSLVLHKNLISCREDGTVSLVTNKITVGEVSSTKFKAHALCDETITYSAPFVMLQIYVNPVLHFLVDAAFIVIILRSLGEINKDELFRHFCALRSIFSSEFVLMESWYKMKFEEALGNLTNEKVILLRDEKYGIFEISCLERVLSLSVQPFILSYYLVAVVLQEIRETIDEKSILSNAQKLLEDAISKKTIFIHPYCMTLDTLTNCLNSFSKLNILKKSRRDKRSTYQVNQEKLAEFKKIIEGYIEPIYGVNFFKIFLDTKCKM